MLHFPAWKPTSIPMKSANFGYIPALDHLRGFAALLVLFFHGSHFISHKIIYGTPYDPAHWPRAENPFSALVIEGHTAVSLFFVLSGFVFTVGSLEKKLNYFGFFRNRLLRTYPLFLFILLLGIAFNPGNFNLPGLLQSLFFLANSETALNGGAFTFVFWSIAVEWHFYLAFPFLLLAVQKKGWKVLPLLIGIFLLLRVLAYLLGADMRDISYWSIIGRIDQFLLGMLAGFYYRHRFKQGKELDRLAVAAVGGVLAVLFGFNQLGGGGINNYLWIFWPTIEGASWAIFVLGYLSISRHFGARLSRALIGLGTVSYSIYLVHYIVLDFFMQRDLDTLLQLSNPLGTAVLNTLLLIAPLVVLISAISYRCIERPFLLRRKTYVNRS